MSIANELADSFNKFVKQATTHSLKPGETVGKLSRIYNVTEEQIFNANKDKNLKERQNSLKIGESIEIPTSSKSFSEGLKGKPLLNQMNESAAFAGVPADLFKAMIQVESQNCTQNTSSAGARGCGQLMPNILSLFGVKDPDDPAENLPASAQYLSSLLTTAPGTNDDEKQWNSLMMYNWGPGNFKSWYTTRDPNKLNAEAKSHPKKVFDILGRQVPELYKGLYTKS